MNYKPVSDRDFKFIQCDQVHTGDKGMWSRARYVGKSIPIVACKECGGLISLHENHTVADDGKVSPSIGCGWCGWHVFGRLCGW